MAGELLRGDAQQIMQSAHKHHVNISVELHSLLGIDIWETLTEIDLPEAINFTCGMFKIACPRFDVCHSTFRGLHLVTIWPKENVR